MTKTITLRIHQTCIIFFAGTLIYCITMNTLILIIYHYSGKSVVDDILTRIFQGTGVPHAEAYKSMIDTQVTGK